MKEDSPLAILFSFSSTMSIFSPFSKGPSTLIIPAGSKLLPSLSARDAPWSIYILPEEFRELMIHFFLASKLEILGITRRAQKAQELIDK